MERIEQVRQLEDQLGGWVSELHIACRTLRRSGPGIVKTVSISDQLRSEDDQSFFLALINRLQDEYHVRASVRLDGRSFSVRFGRENDSSFDHQTSEIQGAKKKICPEAGAPAATGTAKSPALNTGEK